MIAEILRNEIDTHFEPDVYKESSTVDIRELINSEETLGELSEELTTIKPDIQFSKWDENKIVIIEITVPYNQETMINGEVVNTLEVRQNEKERKYKNLIEEKLNDDDNELTYCVAYAPTELRNTNPAICSRSVFTKRDSMM